MMMELRGIAMLSQTLIAPSQARGVRILLVDDHTLFREGLRRLLESDAALEIVADCTSVDEAIAILTREEIDLVLLDYELHGERGTSLLEYLQQRNANAAGTGIRVLLVTAGMTEAETLHVLRSGANGIFLKHSPPDHLSEAIRATMMGQQWLDPQSVRLMVESAAVRAANPPVQQIPLARPLTAREREVLKGIFEGLTNKEIASLLDVSESSVKAVIQQLFAKTGVRTRSQLVRIALEKHASDWL
jgi:two-component system nitrate/nitrite response regulator NarL